METIKFIEIGGVLLKTWILQDQDSIIPSIGDMVVIGNCNYRVDSRTFDYDFLQVKVYLNA